MTHSSRPQAVRHGVTLIELLVAMSVSGLVLIAVLGIFGFSTRQLGTQTGRAETQLLANQAMNAVAKDVANSISVQNDSSGVMSVLTLPANTDPSGNYTPVMQNGSLTYAAGQLLHYHLSNPAGTAQTGACLWREQWHPILGPIGYWSPDTSWSLLPGGSPALPKFQSVTSLSFTTTGMPANTVQVTLVMSDREGGQTSVYTVSRAVYLSNHN